MTSRPIGKYIYGIIKLTVMLSCLLKTRAPHGWALYAHHLREAHNDFQGHLAELEVANPKSLVKCLHQVSKLIDREATVECQINAPCTLTNTLVNSGGPGEDFRGIQPILAIFD